MDSCPGEFVIMYDVVVVGGGPGGYPAALRLASLGYRVALVEADRVGGECTNYGCVPTKAMLALAESVRLLGKVGVLDKVEGPGFEGFVEWALRSARDVSSGLESLLRRRGVDVYYGEAVPVGPTVVEVGGERLEGRAVLASLGSAPVELPGVRIDGRLVLDNRGVLRRGALEGASNVAIVGGGFIGVELAVILSTAGFSVDLYEATSRLLPGFEREFSSLARRLLRSLGVRVRLSTPVSRSRVEDDGVLLFDGSGWRRYDRVVLAVGRRPRSGFYERLGASLDDRGFVVVDDCGRTSIPGLYAAGDVTGPPLLAHKAMYESLRAAECIAGGEPLVYGPIPRVVYGFVDMVSVGATLDEARGSGRRAVEVRIPAGWLARSRAHGVREGFVKLVVEEPSGRVLGVHMAFPGASEAAAAASLIVGLGLTVHDIADIVYPHPTFSEALEEAVWAYLGRSVHAEGVRRG